MSSSSAQPSRPSPAQPDPVDHSELLVIDDEPLDVLIIDDDFLIRTVLAASLTDASYTFRCAADGHSALTLLTQRRFKLVVTDLYMPKMDGFEVISRYIAADPAAMILTISGGGGSLVRELALKSSLLMGSFRSLPKPFTTSQFLGAVEEMIGPPTHSPGSSAPASSPPATPGAT
jgi:two-component system response regulator HydG